MAMKTLTIAVITCLIVSMMPLSLVPNEVKAEFFATITWNGTHIVTDAEIYIDQVIDANGDVIIEKNGYLKLEGSYLQMNAPIELNQYNLTVRGILELSYYSSAKNTTGESRIFSKQIENTGIWAVARLWYFVIEQGGYVEIKDNCRISHVADGILVNDNIYINGATISWNSNYGLRIIGDGIQTLRAELTDVSIENIQNIDTNIGIYSEYAKPQITRGSIEGVSITTNSDADITNAQITGNGLNIDSSRADVEVSNIKNVRVVNTNILEKPTSFRNNNLAGITIDGSKVNLDGNTITGNTRISNSSDVKIYNKNKISNAVIVSDSKIEVQNNEITASQGYGLSINGTTEGNITDNIIKNSQNVGIYLEGIGPNKLTIKDNIIEDGQSHGIKVSSSFVTLDNNKITGHKAGTSAGVLIQDTSNVLIKNSMEISDNIYGIKIQDGSYANINNSKISDSERDGIYVDTSSATVISSTIAKSGRKDINLTDANIAMIDSQWTDQWIDDANSYIDVGWFLNVFVYIQLYPSGILGVPGATITVKDNVSATTSSYKTNATGYKDEIICREKRIENQDNTNGDKITVFTPHDITAEKATSKAYANDTWITESQSLMLKLSPTPDVIVNSIKLTVLNTTADDLTTIKKGEEVIISSEVQNQGNMLAEKTDVNFYYYYNGEKAIGSAVSIDNLAEGDANSTTIKWTVPTTMSTTTKIIVKTKITNPNEYEIITENNNLEKKDITVKSSNWENAFPTVSIISPTTGQEVSGTITIKGTANDTAGSDSIKDPITYVKIKLKKTGNEYSYKVIPDNYYDEKYNWNYELDTTLIPDGTYELQVKSCDGRDEGNYTAITIKINNIDSIAISRKISPTTIYEGDNISVEGNAKYNDGKVVRRATVDVQITKQYSNTVETSSSTTTDNYGNFSLTIKAPTLKGSPSTTDNYKLTIKITGQRDDETIEGETTEYITVKEKPVPILTGTIELKREKIYLGEKFKNIASVKIKNSDSATASAEDLIVKFYINNELVGSVTITKIGIGSTEDVNLGGIDYTFNNTGTAIIKIEFKTGVDETKTVTEEAEVVIGPDIKVKKITFEPATPREGDDVKIVVEIENLGEVDVENFTITLFINDKEEGSKEKMSIKANETKVFSFVWSKPSTDSYDIRIKVSDVNDEVITENNEKTVSITVEKSAYWWLPYTAIGVIGAIVIILSIVYKFRKKKVIAPPPYQQQVPSEQQKPQSQEPSPPFKQM